MAQEYIPTSTVSPLVTFNSMDDWLKLQQEPIRQTQSDTTQGPQNTTQAPAIAPAQASPGKPDTTVWPTTPQREYTAPASGQVSAGTYTPNPRIQGAFSNLFQPTEQNLQTQYGALGGLATNFNAASGANRSWAGIGGQGQLDTAIQNKDVAAGQGLVQAGANYKPAALDQAALDKMIAPWQDSLARGRSLDTSAGAMDLLNAQNPGMTPGEQRLSGQNLWAQPGYQDSAEGVQQDIAQFYGDFLRTQGEALAQSKARMGQEQDISKQASGYLTGKNTDWMTGQQAKVGEANVKGQTVKDAWQAFTETGKAPDASLTSGIPNTEFDQNQVKARQLWDSTMAQFANLKDVPMMGLGLDGQGREQYQFPKEFLKAHPEEDPRNPGYKGVLRKQAIARQHALENAGFSPGSLQEKLPQGTKTHLGMPIGQNAAYNPLYQGQVGSYKPANLLDYSTLMSGTTPTVENLAGAGEVDRYNLILQMLGQGDQSLTPATTPESQYNAPLINIDTAGFTAEEKANYDRVTKLLQAAALDEQKRAGSARREYRANAGLIGRDTGALMGQIGGAVIGGGLFSPLTIPLGGTQGGNWGERI